MELIVLRMKKRFLACAVLVIIFTLVTQTTLAYFSTASTARNVITSGKVEVELVEKTGEFDTEAELLALPEFKDLEGIVPGMDVSKIVFVRGAAGSADAWVRIKCDVTVAGFTAEQIGKAISLDYDKNNWTEKDGYWYYNSPLKADQLTKPLFTTVTFTTEMGNEYQSCDVVITVQAEAVQVANNGATALAAAGWTE